jgi:hypothetical protein
LIKEGLYNMKVIKCACLLVGAWTFALLTGCGQGEPKAEVKATVQPPVQLTAAFEKIKGKWMRSDGGYSLEFKRLMPNNDLVAAYFNPGPIHVGKARLYEERGFTKVFVELQDVNYPGSRYTLILNAEKNQLVGNYFQATQGVDYEVSFEKM